MEIFVTKNVDFFLLQSLKSKTRWNRIFFITVSSNNIFFRQLQQITQTGENILFQRVSLNKKNNFFLFQRDLSNKSN